MTAIYKREMRSYFSSPVGYIFVAIFLAVSAFLFMQFTVQAGEESSFSLYFSYILYVFIVVIPLITMKLLSEERKLRTEQLILTGPVSLWGIVTAKFFAAFTLFGGTFAVSCVIYYIPLSKYCSSEDMSALTIRFICGAIAILLAGAAFIAIGEFISSLTENQFIAAFGTIASIILLLLISVLNNYINSEFIRTILSAISFSARYTNFAAGVFDYSTIVYFSSVSALFLFLTVRVFEKRRWA